MKLIENRIEIELYSGFSSSIQYVEEKKRNSMKILRKKLLLFGLVVEEKQLLLQKFEFQLKRKRYYITINDLRKKSNEHTVKKKLLKIAKREKENCVFKM